MIVTPMIAAGRGRQAFIRTALIQLVLVIVIWLFSLPMILESFEHWQTDGLAIFPFLILLLFPLTLGGIILLAKASEDKPAKNVCRVCGYDLRASPVRCPECGTLVQHDPERF